MRSAASALGAFVISTAPIACGAQAAQAAPDATGPGVTVTGHRADPRRNDTAGKVVVRREELLSHGDTNLGDALKRIPGVSVNADGDIALRGLGNGYTQVLINGEKPPAGFSLSSLSPEMIDRIEIIRSPTADSRTEAIAGTINIVLRKVVTANAREFQLTAGQTRGQPQIALSGSLSGRHEHLSYSLSGALNHDDATFLTVSTLTGADAAGTVNSIINNRQSGATHDDRLSLTPNITLNADDGSSLSVQGLAQVRRQKVYLLLTSVAQLGPSLPFASNPQSATFDSRTARLDINHKRSFGETAGLDLKLSLNGFTRNGTARQTGFTDTGAPALDYTVTSLIDEHGVTTSGKYSNHAARAHTLEFGWDGSVSWRYETRIERDVPLLATSLGNSDLLFHATVRRAAVYAQDNWTVTPQWSLYFGLRSEQMDTLSRGTGYAPIHNRIATVSPLFQSLWKLSDGGDQIRMALNRTFKAPTIANLVPRPYTSANNTVLMPDGRGNPNLKPELAWGLDVSYEHYWKGDAMVSLGGYIRRIDGVIRSDTRLESGRWVRAPFNGGKAEIEGLEFETRFSLAQLATGAPPVDVHFSLARNWSKIADLTRPGNVIADQAPLTSTLALEDKLDASWTVGGSYIYTQGALVRQSAAEIDTSAETHEIDVYAVREMSKTTKLRFSADNLLQRDARNASIYADASGTATEVGRSRSPLTVRVTLEAKY